MKIEGKAHAKINWALDIVGRRGDGYHLLDMVMQSIDLSDEMTFETSEGLSLVVNGAPDPDPERNLVIRAARALMARAGRSLGAAIALEKHIPARAGLGGGSADCALTLRALNRLWGLNLPEQTLLDIGGRLGADVPFCLTGGLARVTGIGEIIEPASGGPAAALVLVTPGGGLSTAEVFSLWDSGDFPPVALDAPALCRALTRGDLRAAGALCRNALTAPAVSLMPEIGARIEGFRAMGAAAAFMTGSGSTVVAAFESEAEARAAAATVPGAMVCHTQGIQPPSQREVARSAGGSLRVDGRMEE